MREAADAVGCRIGRASRGVQWAMRCCAGMLMTLLLVLLSPVEARAQVPSYPWPQAGATVIELRADDPAATLYQLTGETMRLVHYRHHVGLRRVGLWTALCRTPCGVAVDTNGVYKIDGLRMVPSDSFVVPAAGFVSLDVSAGHAGPRVGGVLLTTFGGTAAVLGIVFTSVAFGIGNSDGDGPSRGFLTAGLVLLGSGAAMLAGGIAMLLASRTIVRTSEGYRLAVAGRPTGLRLAPDGVHF